MQLLQQTKILLLLDFLTFPKNLFGLIALGDIVNLTMDCFLLIY